MAHRRVVMLGIVCAAALAIAVGAAGSAAPEPQRFTILLTTSSAGVEARCEAGCAWKTLSYSCGDNATSCTVRVDQFGVAGARRETPAP